MAAYVFRIVVVRSWLLDPRAIEEALREAGVDAALTSVDFKAALVAALSHDHFDAAIFDPNTTELSRADVEACLRESGRSTPLIVLHDLATIGAAVRTALEVLRN